MPSRLRVNLPTFDQDIFSRERLNLIVRLIEQHLRNLAEEQDLSDYALADHSHTLSDITDYETPSFALDDLTDVTAPSPDTNDVLAWNGSVWAPASFGSLSGLSLDDLTDVVLSEPPADYSLLVYFPELGMWGDMPPDSPFLPFLPTAGGTMTGDINFNGVAAVFSGGLTIESDGTDGSITSVGAIALDAVTSIDLTAPAVTLDVTDLTIDSTGDFDINFNRITYTHANGTLTLSEGFLYPADLTFYLTATQPTGFSLIELDGPAGGGVNFYDEGTYIGSIFSWLGTSIRVESEDDIYLNPGYFPAMILSPYYVEIFRALNLDPQAGDITSPVDGDLWYDDTTDKFRARQAGVSYDLLNTSPVAALNDLSDVTLTTPADKMYLKYDSGSSQWIDDYVRELYVGSTLAVNTFTNANNTGIHVEGTTSWATVELYGNTGGTVDFFDAGVYIGSVYGDGTLREVLVEAYENGDAAGASVWGTGSRVFLRYEGTDVVTVEDTLRALFHRGINLQPVAGNLASPVDGDVWYNDTTDKFMAREAGTSYEVISRPLDVAVFVQGKPTNAELVARLEVPRAFTIPASATGSQASARVASTGNVSFDVLKNGVSFATVVFNVSATGSFTMASSATFAAGDLLTITAPATADATLEDISITFVGSRT
jgi:hypothetical protein